MDTKPAEKDPEKKEVPSNWPTGLPRPGDQVEVIFAPDKKRGQMWLVLEVAPGAPGRLVLIPTSKTVSKAYKGGSRAGTCL